MDTTCSADDDDASNAKRVHLSTPPRVAFVDLCDDVLEIIISFSWWPSVINLGMTCRRMRDIVHAATATWFLCSRVRYYFTRYCDFAPAARVAHTLAEMHSRLGEQLYEDLALNEGDDDASLPHFTFKPYSTADDFVYAQLFEPTSWPLRRYLWSECNTDCCESGTRIEDICKFVNKFQNMLYDPPDESQSNDNGGVPPPPMLRDVKLDSARLSRAHLRICERIVSEHIDTSSNNHVLLMFTTVSEPAFRFALAHYRLDKVPRIRAQVVEYLAKYRSWDRVMALAQQYRDTDTLRVAKKFGQLKYVIADGRKVRLNALLLPDNDRGRLSCRTILSAFPEILDRWKGILAKHKAYKYQYGRSICFVRELRAAGANMSRVSRVVFDECSVMHATPMQWCQAIAGNDAAGQLLYAKRKNSIMDQLKFNLRCCMHKNYEKKSDINVAVVAAAVRDLRPNNVVRLVRACDESLPSLVRKLVQNIRQNRIIVDLVCALYASYSRKSTVAADIHMRLPPEALYTMTIQDFEQLRSMGIRLHYSDVTNEQFFHLLVENRAIALYVQNERAALAQKGLQDSSEELALREWKCLAQVVVYDSDR